MTVEVIKHDLFFNQRFRKVGMIKASFNDLVRAFGDPSHAGEFLDYGSQAEWLIELNGEYVMVYDYYVASSPVTNTDWTVSGQCDASLDLVKKALEEVK
tara:strand:+ start:252 stop:548 length:297 start_codon:yes stop_codon:yes gene_type:complete